MGLGEAPEDPVDVRRVGVAREGEQEAREPFAVLLGELGEHVRLAPGAAGIVPPRVERGLVLEVCRDQVEPQP